jgi:hypothetical protein
MYKIFKSGIMGATQRNYRVTYAGQGTGEYFEGKRLSFLNQNTDAEIAYEVNLQSGLNFISLGYTGKNSDGELCFATRMDGQNFGEVLRIKEVA